MCCSGDQKLQTYYLILLLFASAVEHILAHPCLSSVQHRAIVKIFIMLNK